MSTLLAHVMPWFGDGNIHRVNSYVSNTQSVILNQIKILQGTKINNEIIRGVILTWQGPHATFQHSTVTQWCTLCAAHRMLFVLLMDPWIAKLSSTGDPTTTTINALNDPTSQAMFNSAAYIPEKFVLDFNTGANLATLASTFPTLTFLQQGVGFSWPSINMSIPNSLSRNANSVTNLQSQNSHAGMKIPGFLGVRFDDSGMPTPQGVSLSAWTGTRDYNSSVWGGGNRVLDDQGGKLYLDQWGVTQNPTVPSSVPYAAVVTWNDYDEGTAIEGYAAAALGVRIGS